MSEPELPGDDERWLVVDERRFEFIIMDTRLLADTSIDAVAYTVYGGLVWHADRQREAWPSVPTLAGYARVSPNRARQALRDLTTAGYITQRERPGDSKVFALLDLRKAGPLPTGPSPWGTPSDPEGVPAAGPRDYPADLGGRDRGTQAPMARDYPPGEAPPTPSNPEGVLSTTPSDPEGDPFRSGGGSSTPNQTATPRPPAGFDAHRRRRRAGTNSTELSRGLGKQVDHARLAATARERAITLAKNLARPIRDGHESREGLAQRIRREVCRPLNEIGGVFDIEAVVEAGQAAVDAVWADDAEGRRLSADVDVAPWEPTEGPGSGDDRYRFRPGGETCDVDEQPDASSSLAIVDGAFHCGRPTKSSTNQPNTTEALPDA